MDNDERWRYVEFGLAFEAKYRCLRTLASQDERFLEKKPTWWYESEVAAAMVLKDSQWSNLRSAKPRRDAYIHARELVRLALRFELNGALGSEAWQLFLPHVSLSAFDAALRKADYGGKKGGASSDRLTDGFAIPQLDRYVLRCPATLEEYDQTVKITQAFFSEDVVDLEADRVEFLKNPYSMVVLIDTDSGQVLGWVDIYYLPDADIEAMIEDGEVRVDPARIIRYPDTGKVKRAYTASILINGHRKSLVRLLIYGMMEFLLKFQFHETDTFELFAIGSTNEGERLLRALQFSFVRLMQMEGGLRGLFSRKFTKPELLRESRFFWRKYAIHRLDVRLDINDPPPA